MRFLSPVYFIDEVELIGDDENAQAANAILKALGMSSIPKMEGEKVLSKERVTQYYDRQRKSVSKNKNSKSSPTTATGTEEPKQELPDCCVCLTRTAGALILPCGHNNTCHECALQLCTLRHRGEHRCPICRGYIEKVLQADCPTKAEAFAASGMTSWFNVNQWNFLAR